ncbi:MAG: hypothetical protein CVV05_00125 [Gammaproteobacteria bacterium HGW-Gammaproteobacteria-1]|jgi:hypothetical protein|nr:MAG: hypothetical protein CVV05_00125 [Gammaproteobacteria bacterium HGW-Gammaproteobacteria-1]
MLARILKRVPDDKCVLVDWTSLDRHWFSGQIRPPDRAALFDKYLWLWFKGQGDALWFEVPEVGWDSAAETISFTNGRNRTALITKHQRYVPVALEGDESEWGPVRGAVVRPLEDGDLVILPDLPILSSDEWDRCMRGEAEW